MSDESAVWKKLMGEDWGFLFSWLKAKVQQQINWYQARGAKDGVLPDGNNADSITAEVVAVVFEQGRARPEDYTEQELQARMERLGYNLTHTLHYRKERSLTQSEWDFGLVDEAGEPKSIFEDMMGPSLSPDEELMAGEEQALGEDAKAEFERSLEAEPELLAVWRCLRSGLGKREEIAKRLGISVSEVKNRRKRLERRAAEFGKQRGNGAGG